MTKSQIKQILLTARALQQEEERIDQAFRGFVSSVCPSGYPPFIEKGMVHGYLEALRVIDPTLSDYVSYWLYDVPTKSDYNWVVVDQYGVEYDARDVNQYVKFIMTV
jgi:hypothetical protein